MVWDLACVVKNKYLSQYFYFPIQKTKSGYIKVLRNVTKLSAFMLKTRTNTVHFKRVWKLFPYSIFVEWIKKLRGIDWKSYFQTLKYRTYTKK